MYRSEYYLHSALWCGVAPDKIWVLLTKSHRVRALHPSIPLSHAPIFCVKCRSSKVHLQLIRLQRERGVGGGGREALVLLGPPLFLTHFQELKSWQAVGCWWISAELQCRQRPADGVQHISDIGLPTQWYAYQRSTSELSFASFLLCHSGKVHNAAVLDFVDCLTSCFF